MAVFFYDSYAVLAYLDDRMFEAHGSLAASRVIAAFSKYQRDFDISEIKGAMRLRFRLKKRGRNISYVDALGYHLALNGHVTAFDWRN